jgi:cephalosporin hydroxylase
MDHVYQELLLLLPLLQKGDYVVVEDSDINGHPVLPSYGPGPWEAVRRCV